MRITNMVKNSIDNGPGIRLVIEIENANKFAINTKDAFNEYKESILKEIVKPYISGITIIALENLNEYSQVLLYTLLVSIKKVVGSLNLNKSIWIVNKQLSNVKKDGKYKFKMPFMKPILELVDILVVSRLKNYRYGLYKDNIIENKIDIKKTFKNKNKKLVII